VEDNLISEGLFIGESLSAIYDYTIDGLWQLDDEIPPGYEFGSYKVVDLNGDGVIDPKDKSIIGDRAPAYRFGINSLLNYKNLSFSFFINSVQGGKDRYRGEDNLYGLSIFNTETHFNHAFPEGLDYWTPENTDARYQRPGIAGSSGIAGNRWAPRNFVRLRSARLSYNFNTAGMAKVGIKNLRLFISGENLLTWTKWNGWDPETGVDIDDSGRPVMRSYAFGIDITL
ncbi:MAG: SusC/RagA family TonB-linked outer membrane protein, partial [Bacteroidales bacterium]|nr:SusC/RagA family TonB-linked outer membrane protein [Bacteroidales bacterium]